jgi:radical SAM protein with 4Fe4S-binding SPASM domain
MDNLLNQNTVTSFIFSKENNQLKSTRVLYYIKERLLNYNTSSKEIIQSRLNPVSIALCPTSICNRACCFCSNKQRNKINRKKNILFSENVFQEIMDDLKKLNVKGVSLAGGGEPLTYSLKLLTEFLCQKEIKYKIGIHSNGINLNKLLSDSVIESKNISYINLSCVAHNPDIYKKITSQGSSQFYLIENNIKLANNLKEKYKHFPVLGVKILICKENFKIINEVYNYFKSLNVENILLRCVGNFEEDQDVQLSSSQNEELSNILINYLHIEKEKINAIIGRSDIILPKPSRCWIAALQYTAGIDPDGEVYLCSPWSRKDFSIGNVNKDRLNKVWGGNRHKEIAELLNNNLQNNLCNQLTCRHYFSNLAIDMYLAGKIDAFNDNNYEKDYGRFI